MTCPECGGDTRVPETNSDAENVVRRRRVCVDCGHRFTTYEVERGFVVVALAPEEWAEIEAARQRKGVTA